MKQGLLFATLVLVAATPLAAAGEPTPARPLTAKQTPWQVLITNADRRRLKDWRDTWLDGIRQAEAGGFRAAIDKEGRVLQPDAALDHAEAPDGTYTCRWIKLGRRVVWGQKTGAPYQIEAPVPCTIKGSHFRARGGTLRPNGNFWTYDAARLLFLGGISVGDEAATIPYGRDPDRNAIGLFERIGDRRWRMVLPQPAWEATIDIVEITPAG